jgi:ABC-type molybdate transport system substrate-binding protein
MMARKIVFALLAFIILFAGCGKKSGDAKNEIFIICDTSYNLPAAQLAAKFKERTGIDSMITIATGADILALVKIGKAGDIVITDDPSLEHISNAGALAANTEVGFTASADTPQDTQQQPKRIHVIALNYSENSMAIIQFIEFTRERGSEIFTKYGY